MKELFILQLQRMILVCYFVNEHFQELTILDIWIEYMLLCRKHNDFKAATTVRGKMNSSYKDPNEVEMQFEQRIQNSD